MNTVERNIFEVGGHYINSTLSRVRGAECGEIEIVARTPRFVTFCFYPDDYQIEHKKKVYRAGDQERIFIDVKPGTDDKYVYCAADRVTAEVSA